MKTMIKFSLHFYLFMFVCMNFFLFCRKSSTVWNIYVLGLLRNTSLSLGLNTRFNSSVYFRLLVLSIMPQHRLAIECLYAYLF